MAAYDDLDVKRIFVVGISSVVVTAVTALAVQVLVLLAGTVAGSGDRPRQAITSGRTKS